MTHIQFEPSPELQALVLRAFKIRNPEADESVFQDQELLSELADTVIEALIGLVVTESRRLTKINDKKSLFTSGGEIVPRLQDCFPGRVHLLLTDKAEFSQMLGRELLAYLVQHGPIYQPPPNEQLELLTIEGGEVVVLAEPNKPEVLNPYRQKATRTHYGAKKNVVLKRKKHLMINKISLAAQCFCGSRDD